MKIGKQIDEIIEFNRKLKQFRDQNDLRTKADESILVYSKRINELKFNQTLIQDFVSLLQLSNEKSIYEQYKLEDIERLYDSIVRTNGDNLENILNAANFQWNVMNSKEKAIEYLEMGIKLTEKKNQEFHELFDEIMKG